MDSGGRLPEDIAAEQAYLAELRGEKQAAAKAEASSQRARLEAQGLIPPAAESAAVAQARAVPAAERSPAQLALLEAEVLARVQAELMEKQSALTRPARRGFVSWTGRLLDNVMALVTGRKTW